MTEINYEKCQKIWEIKKKQDSDTIFIIDDISKFSDYTSGGYIEERPIPKKMKYFCLSKKFEIPFTQEEDEFLNWKQKLIFIIFASAGMRQPHSRAMAAIRPQQLSKLLSVTSIRQMGSMNR